MTSLTQPTLWTQPTAGQGTDDATVDRWADMLQRLQAGRRAAGLENARAFSRERATTAVKTVLKVGEMSACAMALDASKDLIVAVVFVSSDARDVLTSAALLVVVMVALWTIQTIARRLESHTDASEH